MVNWTVPARNDLKEIHDYIKKDSVFYAKKVVSGIVEKTKMLNDFPQAGRIVPEIKDEHIREIILYSYRIIYRQTESSIQILAVMHGKMDVKEEIIDR